MSYPTNIHEKYHAHVYFDRDTLGYARELCAEAGERFGIQVGRVHERPVGPQPLLELPTGIRHHCVR